LLLPETPGLEKSWRDSSQGWIWLGCSSQGLQGSSRRAAQLMKGWIMLPVCRRAGLQWEGRLPGLKMSANL
jgi:hypothetical protein